MRQEDDLPRLAAGGEPSLLRAHAGYADAAVHLRPALRHRDLPPASGGLHLRLRLHEHGGRESEHSEFRASPTLKAQSLHNEIFQGVLIRGGCTNVSRTSTERNISYANWNGITCKAPEAQIKFISNYFQ